MRKRPQRTLAAGARLIEGAISPAGRPVIGLYLFMAYGLLRRSMGRDSQFASINPAVIGVPALLRAFPGLSQTELADLMGVERMTAGQQVAQCIRAGLVTRRRSAEDRRRYVLQVTAKGVANLRRISRLIPLHEQSLFGVLAARERKALYRALAKLVEAGMDRPAEL
jgi:DNA-binding MarR family transcriptional regulator